MLRVAQASRVVSWWQYIEDFVDMRRVSVLGVADVCVRYVNRRVLGNIEATNATRGHIHRYKHSPRRGTLSRSMWGSLRLAPIKKHTKMNSDDIEK